MMHKLLVFIIMEVLAQSTDDTSPDCKEAKDVREDLGEAKYLQKWLHLFETSKGVTYFNSEQHNGSMEVKRVQKPILVERPIKNKKTD